ncbi:acyl-CoA dehydrogenase family protein [Paenibacillus sp. MMS18-CY102]|uniref:acyl-CoA dehydrogenase family protein n=1 Tax=Paenibacillus sp. MMS18-CY102 TaxID=2682849 RepID=UPI0013657DD1|nr:acyl-CoA dehydrogenase family protein [Paenibacillus sp. MMS18-CY102]MWC28003.1 acyl-CoA dehydrogenase [Paenibacillus sp. MMS18-CY102]
MELRFTDGQEAIRQKARQFAVEEITPLIPHMEEDGDSSFPAELAKRMAELDLMGIPIPKQWGGAGNDFISYIAAINEISRVSAAVGVILSVHTSVGTLPILYYGTEQQRIGYVSKLASGQWLGAFALTEPQAGSDAASIRTRAVKSGSQYVLNGTKMFITNAGAADLYITFAVTDPAQGPGGITAFLLERGAQGLTIGKKEKKMGLHGSNTCELTFEDVHIPASQRLGEEGQGFAIAKGSLDGGRIGIAAQSLGIAEAALQLLHSGLAIPPRNKQANSPIRGRIRSSADAVRVAALTAQVEAARLLVYRAAYMRQEGQPCTRESSAAKLFASDTAVEVAGAAVRWLGRAGYSKLEPAERLFRDAKVTQIYEGTNEIHRIVIGNQLLK